MQRKWGFFAVRFASAKTGNGQKIRLLVISWANMGKVLVHFNFFNLSLPRLVFLLGFSNLLHVSHQTPQAHPMSL